MYTASHDHDTPEALFFLDGLVGIFGARAYKIVPNRTALDPPQSWALPGLRPMGPTPMISETALRSTRMSNTVSDETRAVSRLTPETQISCVIKLINSGIQKAGTEKSDNRGMKSLSIFFRMKDGMVAGRMPSLGMGTIGGGAPVIGSLARTTVHERI